MNRLRVRLVRPSWTTAEKGPAGLDPVIDGSPLRLLVQRATAGRVSGSQPRVADVLWSGRELWLGHQPDAQSGLGMTGRRVAVLLCECGSFGCGGVGARIELDDGEVRWSNFAEARDAQPVAVGPFRFSEARYREEIERVLREERRGWMGT